MKLSFIIFLLALLISSCASTFGNKYVGGDVRLIEIDNGPPINVFDYQGQRVFQWIYGGGTFTIPQRTSVYGSASQVGNGAIYSSTAITTGGNSITTDGCVLSFFTDYDEEKNMWVVERFSFPFEIVC